MATLRVLLLGAFTLMSIACSGTDPRSVVTDMNSGVNFQIYKSYRWFEGPFFEGNAATANEAVYRTLRDSISTLLGNAGLEWKQYERVEMVVHIHAGMSTRPPIDQWTAFNWYKPWWGVFAPLSDVAMYEPGMLVIDVIDAAKVELVWRALLPDCFTEDGQIADVARFGQQLREAFSTLPIRR